MPARISSVRILMALLGCLVLLAAPTVAGSADVGAADESGGGVTPSPQAVPTYAQPQTDGTSCSLRVLLSSRLPRLSVECATSVAVFAADGSDCGQLVGPVSVSVEAVGVRLQGPSGAYSGASFTLQPAGSDLLRYQGTKYRGVFRVSRSARGGVLLLNVVELEDYLRGVVPAEMPALWAPEAVKAQAVAARTYALSRQRTSREGPYDVTADVSDQVYRGTSGEHPASDAAVEATAGMVVTYGREPIIAYYHSCSGGHTRDGEEPYLVGVTSPEESPYDRWELEYTFAQLSEFLQKGGFAVGRVTNVRSVPAPDVRDGFRVQFDGSAASVELTPVQVRRMLGVNTLRSPRFRVEALGSEGTGLAELKYWMRTRIISAKEETEVKVRNCVVYNGDDFRRLTGTHQVLTRVQRLDGVRLAGGGYGHGLGLSQYGAKYMAEHGADWREIIHHYYSGVEIVDISEVGRMPAF